MKKFFKKAERETRRIDHQVKNLLHIANHPENISKLQKKLDDTTKKIEDLDNQKQRWRYGESKYEHDPELLELENKVKSLSYRELIELNDKIENSKDPLNNGGISRPNEKSEIVSKEMKFREDRIIDNIEIPKMIENYKTDLQYYKNIESECLSLLEQENGISKVRMLKEAHKKDKLASKIINDILQEEEKRFSKQMDELRASRIRNKLFLKDDDELRFYGSKKCNDKLISRLVREEQQLRSEEKKIDLQMNQKIIEIIDSYFEKVANSQLKN
ncbi:unnamed protein product [Blepharisma stoltei]|uniref:Uncharacterized protein n=1 Tax=Blepharisma stoltei TaxID=1481888 RepID=A0AAU9IZN2_9CILI|nr:unnamed protein product [Blepharisma stoltei]